MYVMIFVYIIIFHEGGAEVIDVTRINDTSFVINAEIIQTVEATPDTVITLTTGAKYIVKESCEEVKEKVIAYKRRIFSGIELI